jgi:hypothetical protein
VGSIRRPFAVTVTACLASDALKDSLSALRPTLNQGEDVSRIGLVLISQRDAVVLKSELVDHDIRERRQREPHHPGLVVG